MAKVVIEKGLSNVNEVWGVEVPLYYPGLYAGTTDGCGLHLNDESILDYKQTNRAKRREWIDDYFVQLLMYATAHNEVHGTNIRKGVIFMCSAANEYQEFVLEGAEWAEYEQRMWARLEQYYSQIHK
jgi:genome maintenance exonuclease 1